MTTDLIFDLFSKNLSSSNNSKEFIEVFDFYECSYGSIFYNGQLIKHYEDQDYSNVLSSSSTLKTLQKNGLDIKNIKVIFYDFSLIKEFNSHFNFFDYHKHQNSSYIDLFNSIQKDLNIMQPIITSQELKMNQLCPRSYFDILPALKRRGFPL